MAASSKLCLILAALSGLISVIAGAYAAHGVADPSGQDFMRIASTYEMNHALAVFAAIFVAEKGARRAIVAAWLFLAGALLFCGSLYAVALGAPKAVAIATPAGGLAFMAGWIALVWACIGLKKPA
ncbi:MAG: DUF423 domain-containing protein [Caulobacteraceae bacterium]